MQSAPPGSVALTGCPAWRLAIAAVGLAALGAVAGWAAGRLDGDRDPAFVALAVGLGLGVAAAVAGLLPCPVGRLAWTDGTWRFEPARPGRTGGGPAVEGTISVALDLGNVLLLALHPDDGSLPPGRLARAVARARPRWLPVERRAARGDWHGLRVALAAARTR
jgi:hypothetical protein